ncbi:hypothetical protein SAMN04488581_2628 [Mycolicibacterium neoaurum]|uniref:hypothetical protein n=1 Tax=Mycolicibacterium neoaurum TaxID=1795 RepID=UPI0008830619|nr:hypothetical protein [Mycolicibacterium neoaurum]SDD59837.1 hypothetical protein SAMN04488581_2628 [Mycolicibacterium neoaurum]
MSADKSASPDQIAIADHVKRLRDGVEAVRSGAVHPAQLADLVANWIDAEALMWETAEQYVTLINAVRVQSDTRGGEIRFGLNAAGGLACSVDTSEHALKIIAAATQETRLTPKRIETVEELNAVPEFSVVIDDMADVMERRGDAWMMVGYEGLHLPILPAELIYLPEES